ncbi:MAG: hypothetical protein LBK22_03490, partial [Tannerella sp.]|nr:hypothetical protein [Tannerella sp.]
DNLTWSGVKQCTKPGRVQYNHWIASGCAFAMTGLDPFETASPSCATLARDYPNQTPSGVSL